MAIEIMFQVLVMIHHQVQHQQVHQIHVNILMRVQYKIINHVFHVHNLMVIFQKIQPQNVLVTELKIILFQRDHQFVKLKINY